MFLVTVHLPNAFPFTDNEVFTDSDDAMLRATEWIEWGGALRAEVRDIDSHVEKMALDTYAAIGLGAVFGYKVVDVTDANDRELVAA
jgi:hypothetical protein